MFEKSENKVVIFLYEDVMLYPPVINLIECLLNNGYMTHLVSQNSGRLPDIVNNSPMFSYTVVSAVEGKNIINRIVRRMTFRRDFINALRKYVRKDDIVWTVNPLVVRILGNSLKGCNNHIMELMELTDWIPLFKGAKILSFDIKSVAQNARKVVVPERNRAYIQKIFWELADVPSVLPNKPYYNDPGELTPEIEIVLDKMKKDSKKIIVYLGVIDPDRSLEEFIQAIELIKDEYSLYVFGKLTTYYKDDYIKQLSDKYSVFNYMGFANPPQHLHFLKYAYIALLPYNPGLIYGKSFSKLNALYCAPNKIYEYAGNRVPMVGTDVLALREPFEKYNIGACTKDLRPMSIVEAIKEVDQKHDYYSSNCLKFYNDISIDDIVDNIING